MLECLADTDGAAVSAEELLEHVWDAERWHWHHAEVRRAVCQRLPFTRLDDRTRHDGFGLGLALVSSIASVHNGTAHATVVSTGSLDITVRLPRRHNPVTPASPAT